MSCLPRELCYPDYWALPSSKWDLGSWNTFLTSQEPSKTTHETRVTLESELSILKSNFKANSVIGKKVGRLLSALKSKKTNPSRKKVPCKAQVGEQVHEGKRLRGEAQVIPLPKRLKSDIVGTVMQAQSHGTLEDSFIQDVAETMTSRSNDVKSEELSSNQDYSPSPLDEVEEHGELSQQSQWILKSTGQNVKTIVDYYVSKHTELSADIACHYIVDLTVQRHPKSIRNEFSEEEWSEMLGMQNESPLRLPTACEEMITKFKACNFLTQIDKLDNDFLEGSFSSIEQRRSSDGSHLRYIEFVHKKFFDCWKHDPNRLRNQSQGTFVSRLISSVVEELFVNDVKIVSPNWGELGSVESSIQRIGQQTDIIFNMSDANKTECGFCEVSGPMDQEDATKVRDDREKLAKEMKDALDLVLKRASSAPLERLRKLKIWGIQIEGWTWRLYSISLCYDGLYRFEQLNYCAVPKHPDEWVLISTFCRHLIHFREIILATCKQIEDVIQVSNFTTPPNSPSVTSRIIREAIMTPRKPKGNQRNRDILRKPRRLQF